MVKLSNRPLFVPTPFQMPPVSAPQSATEWRSRLPFLAGSLVALRELHTSDAPSLFAALGTEEVTRFLSPPPSTVGGFEAFVAWEQKQREAGQYVCFAVVPHGSDVAIGMFQIRALDAAFDSAEWGFAIAPEFWGSGVFVDGAQLVIDFAFTVLGVQRLEARAAAGNGRGNGALRKIGAVHEGVLRRSLVKNGQHFDQRLWTILRDEWFDSRRWGAGVILH